LEEENEYTVENFLHSSEEPYTQRGKNNSISILAGNLKLRTANLKRDSLKKQLRVENNFDFILMNCLPKPISEDLTFGEIAVLHLIIYNFSSRL
jgi:chromosome partitioning protein